MQYASTDELKRVIPQKKITVRILYHHRTQGEEPESIHIAAVVDALRALGHTVQVIGPTPVQYRNDARQRRSLAGSVKQAVPRWAFELLQLLYNVVVYYRLAAAVRRFKPDLIYERYALFTWAGVALARRARVPLILEVNTPYAQAWAKYYGLYLQRLARRIEVATLRTASHVITVTAVQKRLLAEAGIAGQHISVCHNAIDPDWFHPQRHAAAALPTSVAAGAVVIGFVGTMNRWQGMPQFPEVVRQVLDACPSAHFLFVGDGEFRSMLESFCQTQGYGARVVFTGRLPHAQVPPLVQRMDIAVLLNSNAYGSPMKIFEYMGMARAIVAPSVAPVCEVLQDGVNGLLIAPGDAGQMAAQIVRLVNDAPLRQRLGAAGRASVVATHTWNRNAGAILQIYAALQADQNASLVPQS